MRARLVLLAAAALPVQVSSTCSCPYWYGASSCPGSTTCPPVFSGEHYVRKQILDLLNARSDPEKAAAVTAAFAENLIDVNNGDHADEVLADIDTKVIARFLGAE